MHTGRCKRGYTLIELVLSLAMMTVLLGAMSSSVLVASRALPAPGDPGLKMMAGAEAVDWILADLSTATSMIMADPTTIEFIVPDRGHGSPGPETIRYEWAGTPGDPLMRTYNGGTSLTIQGDVQSFSLDYAVGVGLRTAPLRVLLVVEDDVSPNAQDLARMTQIQSWGFKVSLIEPGRSDAQFSSELQEANVMYWSEEHPVPPPLWVFSAPCGIVCEKLDSFPDLGISRLANWVWLDSIDIIDNTHEITSSFPTGPLQIFATSGYGVFSSNTLAPDGQVLARGNGYDMLMAVDIGGRLQDGTKAAARRVSMPWGDRDFDFNTVTKDGLQIMKRAIEWAAAPVIVKGVEVTLQVDADPSARIVATGQLLNEPGAP